MLKVLRRYYWVTQSFFARHAKIVVRTTLIVLALIATFFLFSRYLPTPKETIRIGRVGKYTLLDFPPDIQSQISSGLVTFTPDGLVQPGLAKSWTVSPDNLTYTFELATDIFWHNGSHIQPDDITYNFQNVEVQRGEGTITFRLQEPFSPFFSAVSRPILKNNKLGIGEFRLTKITLGNGVLQAIKIENTSSRRIYKFYPTESSAITAYKLGDVDRVEGLSLVPTSIGNDSNTIISQEELLPARQSVLFFNNSDVLLRDNKSVRQALAYAIADKAFGKTRSLSPIDKSSWAYNPLIKTYDYDPDKAKTLFPNAAGTKLEIKTMLQYLPVAESIAESWKQVLGLDVSVKVISNPNSDYQILLADFTSPLDPDQYTIWHSTQATNFTHYSNLKVDKLLEDGRRTSDKKLRKEIYQDFQRFLLEDCPAVFLFQSSAYTISRKPLF